MAVRLAKYSTSFGRLPLQQLTAAHTDAIQGPHDSVSRNPGLMGKERDGDNGSYEGRFGPAPSQRRSLDFTRQPVEQRRQRRDNRRQADHQAPSAVRGARKP